jgi:hypothetical protein
LIYKVFLALQRKSQLSRSKSGEAVSSKTDVAPLVSCAHCGLQLPKDEALRAVSPREGATDSPSTAKPALYFCGKAHARLGPQGERAE